jgi:hypothetical protein
MFYSPLLLDVFGIKNALHGLEGIGLQNDDSV